jgi:hypothetical protein
LTICLRAIFIANLTAETPDCSPRFVGCGNLAFRKHPDGFTTYRIEKVPEFLRRFKP